MFWKILPLIVTLRSAFVQAEGVDDIAGKTNLTIDQNIQMEMLTIMSSSLQALWNVTPSDQNIQLFPVTKTISRNMVQMQMFYESGLAVYFNIERYLEKSYALVNALDRLANSSNVKFQLINAIFYDQRFTNQQYLSDLQKYFHSEAYGMFFDSNNAASVTYSVNKWYSKNTKGKEPKMGNVLLPKMTSYHAKILHFSGCWDTPKTGNNFNVVSRHHRRRRSEPTSEYKVGNVTHMYVETFNARETIGYFNNSKLKYEAIRLPYKNGDFAIVVLLPYENQTLELIANFANEEYVRLLQSINVIHENIDYAIPFMNLSMISFNQNGTTINGHEDDLVNCSWPSGQRYSNVTDPKLYRQFHVNRPFGVLIYHEQTKYILWQALVRNPTRDSYVQPKFMNQVNVLGEVTDRKYVS